MVKRLPLVLLSLVAFAAAFLLHVPIATSQARFRGTAEIAACLRDPHCGLPLVAAHRGGDGGPENSRAAVRSSLAWGVPVLEIDIHRTPDGRLVVMHDATLDRTTSLHGRLSMLTPRQLARARLANGEALPSFADIHRLTARRAVLDLHFWSLEAIPEVAAQLAAAGGFDDAIFFAFSPQQAAAIARVRAAHAAAIVMLKADDPAQLAAGERTLGGPPQLVHVGLFPPAGFVRALRARGIKVWANALAWERLCEPLRFLALTANVGDAQVVQTDDPRAYLRPPPPPPPPREAPREVSAAGAARLWLAVGLTGQLLFSGRFLVQWIASERRRASMMPVSFWYLSLAGGLVLLVYAVYKADLVFVLGQAGGLLIYWRNLWLLARRRERPAAAAGAAPALELRQA